MVKKKEKKLSEREILTTLGYCLFLHDGHLRNDGIWEVLFPKIPLANREKILKKAFEGDGFVGIGNYPVRSAVYISTIRI